MSKKFVHLHLHTEYSLLDGLSRVEELIEHIKEKNMDAVAISDHGAMYGAIEFYKSAIKGGIKPIIGMEAYTTNVEHSLKPERGTYQNFHLLLLAKNEEGYKNLIKITSTAHLEGYYYRPRIKRELLEKYSRGLICTSACAQGEIAQALLEGDYKKAKGIAKWFYDVFGRGYYLEVQRHRYSEFAKIAENPLIKKEVTKMADSEKTINAGVLKLSREMGIPVVATNDAHYIKKEDANAQDTLLCIATGKNVSDINRLRFIDTPSFHVAAVEEMEELFSDLPDALENTVKIANECNLEISTMGKWYFPKFDGDKGEDGGATLKKMVNERLPQKINKITTEVKARLEKELDIIINKGYAPYFLIMSEMVNWANEQGIITNTRGSAAGSLASYILGITTVNPLTYYLPFERFLNPFRPLPPDIDLDVADNRREEVIEHMNEKYGRDKVAQICTFGRMLSRASVRDVARVLGYEYSVGDRIAKLIPPPKQGFPVTIPKALFEVKELSELYDFDKDARKILDLAGQIEGNARHVSVHAAAVVVSPTDIMDFTPLQKEPSGDKIITQYEMHACEDVGLIKFDILGIRNLSILGAAIDTVRLSLGKEIDITKIPLTDKKTFQMLGRGETMGVFQLSGSGMTRYLKELKPERVEDLMVMVALYRPGPMAVIPEYIKRKRNPKLVKYLDPRMKKFLGSSYGLIVYQDDLLFCALELAGYTWEEADKFRKAVGKKIPSEMAAQKAKFIKGIIENGQTKEFAEKLWELFEPFQAYGFNKAHAASYGIIAYYTAYMKANYPVEFMAALLTAESSDADKISGAVGECRRMGITLLPPDINESDTDFKIVPDKASLEKKAIRFGMGAIKNVGKAAIDAILTVRKEDTFHSLADFLSRVDSRKVNKKVLESLIKVGALGSFGNRATLLSSVDEMRMKVSKPKSLTGQQGLFGAEEITKAKKASGIEETRAKVAEFSDEELQALERQLLGFSLSDKPIDEELGNLIFDASHKIEELTGEILSVEEVKIAGIITDIRVVITKRTGQEMAFARVDDGTGSINLVIFPRIYAETRNIWTIRKPLLVHGKIDLREEEPSLIVNAIETKDKKEINEKVYIRIPGRAGKNALKKLKELLLENPGKQAVCLVFEKEKGKRINLAIKITWGSELAAKIEDILDSREAL